MHTKQTGVQYLQKIETLIEIGIPLAQRTQHAHQAITINNPLIQTYRVISHSYVRLLFTIE